MKKTRLFIALLALAVAVPVTILSISATAEDSGAAPARPEGPCDVYARGGAPCVAAHSTTRALYAAYDGPLYQVMRASDGKTLDIGVVKPSAGDPGGYADAEAQDEFCANTTCWITVLYDQSEKANHLYQAPRGAFIGTALGGFDTLPIADMAPVTLGGHKVYGIFIVPGMGLRQNDPRGTAVDDQAEGQYWVINGHHFNSGCCFDYGNAETDSRDDGDGTMETTYYGNQPLWYHGDAPGPWVMTDQENNLVGCVTDSPNNKYCEGLPSITWRFVTATADGEPHHWRSMGGDAQQGELITMYDGIRIQNDRNSYDPMRKQGAILLGNGGDNNNYSSGTFYEGAMTAPNTFPTIETNQAIQANVVAARYDVQRLAITAADKTYAPNGLQTFAPKSLGYVTVTFVNTTGEPLSDLALGIDAPKGWKAVVMGGKDKVKKIGYTVAPGQTVVANFAVTSGKKEFNGDLAAKATWTAGGKAWKEKAVEKVRNVAPVKINEYRVGDGVNTTNAFIELFNAGEKAVKIGGWEIIEHATTQPYFSTIKIPAGTKLAPKSFYLLGLATSGLQVEAAKGDKVLYVRTVEGMKEGDEIIVGGEKRKIASITRPDPAQPAQPMMGRGANAIGTPTTLWQPLPEGPVITIPAGSNNVPVASTLGFKVGSKIAIGYGATYPAATPGLEKYEVATVTAVGKPGTQAYLAYDAKPGETNIKVSNVSNITAGDKIRLDIDSEGHGIEWVTVKSVGTASRVSPGRGPMSLADAGTGLELEEPLKFFHSANMPFACNGTGITFEPATKFDHSSNEPVLALVYEIELDQPLAKNHPIDEVVVVPNVKTAGYQGDVPADQLFGGPALGTMGNMTLYTAKGNVADCLNWGAVVNPMLSEGFHGQSGFEEYGNYIHLPVPNPNAGFGRNVPAIRNVNPNLSAGRYPDGNDTDDNMVDFKFQSSWNLLKEVPAGGQNVKLSSADNFIIGQTVCIGTGENAELAKVALIGTAGATKLNVAAPAGAKMLLVSGITGFVPGQEVFVNGEKLVVESVKQADRWRMMMQPGNTTPPSDTIFLVAPLKKALAVGDEVAGSGVTFTAPLKHAHPAGDVMVSAVPTPGKPNRF